MLVRHRPDAEGIARTRRATLLPAPGGQVHGQCGDADGSGDGGEQFVRAEVSEHAPSVGAGRWAQKIFIIDVAHRWCGSTLPAMSNSPDIQRIITADVDAAVAVIADDFLWASLSVTCREAEALLTILHAHGVADDVLESLLAIHAESDDEEDDRHAHLAGGAS